jgi:GH25 family lysozyme M1 (1,4-beta-N-acetylmuramidase)
MLVGIDYAKVDGNAAPDFAMFKAACARAGSRAAVAIFRGAWGTQFDDTMARDWRRAIDAGFTCGGYLFLRMPHPGFPWTPEDQVHVFAQSMGPLTDRNLVPTIDIEDTGLPAEMEIEWVHRAWTELRRIYGVPPMIYTSDRVWHEDLHDLPAGEMLDSPLWVAKPWPWQVRSPPHLSGEAFAPGKNDPIVPKPWGPNNWWMHQYQGDAHPVPGFTSTIDLSRFHMMQIGETGARVAWVRRRLGMPTGVRTFDSEMLAQVQAFQAQRALAVDGVIGPQTFAALTWSPPPSPAA